MSCSSLRRIRLPSIRHSLRAQESTPSTSHARLYSDYHRNTRQFTQLSRSATGLHRLSQERQATWSPYIALFAVVAGTAVLVEFVTAEEGPSIEIPQEEEQKDQEGQVAVLQDDRVPDYAAMPVPTGFLGNLTAEQEQKLKEFWTQVLKTFGVKDPLAINGATPRASTDTPAPATPEPGSAKKEKRGLFHRKNKEPTSGSGSPAFGGSSDPEDKYGQTKELQDILATSSPADLREAFWSMVKKDHPDALLLRFLRARKWDVHKALAMMITTMHWRRDEMHVDDDVMFQGEGGALKDSQSSDAAVKREGHDFLAQLRMGKSFMHGVDKEGRPLCVVRARLHKGGEQTERSLERYTVYLIESCRLALEPPVETAVSSMLHSRRRLLTCCRRLCST